MCNTLIELIKERRSIRKFKDDVPEDKEILQIIDAARYAPSATNLQPWRFFIIKDMETKMRMAACVEEKLINAHKIKEAGNHESDYKGLFSHFTFFKNAPVVIVVLYKPYPNTVYSFIKQGGKGGDNYDESTMFSHTKSLGMQSVAAATQNLLLAAHSLGLGGCWMDGPLIAEEELKEILAVRPPWELMSVVPIGFPDSIPDTPRRKKIDVIVKFI